MARSKYRMPIPEILQLRKVSESNQVPQATGIQNVLSRGEVQVRFSLRADKWWSFVTPRNSVLKSGAPS